MGSIENAGRPKQWRFRRSSNVSRSSQSSVDSAKPKRSGSGRTSLNFIWSHLSQKASTDSVLENIESNDLINDNKKLYLFWSIFVHKIKLGFRNPLILMVTLLIFTLFCVTGFVVIFYWASSYNDSFYTAQFAKGEDMVDLIDDELYKSQLPLFTLAEMAKQLPAFQSLPINISNAPQFTFNKTNFRDVKSICSNENNAAKEEFISFSNSFKQNSQMPAGLVQTQLAPQGVVCFEYEYVSSLKPTSLQGFDVLNNTDTQYYAYQSLQTNQTSLQGPVYLNYNHDQVLIARYPLYSLNKFWGFSSVIIDWKMIEQKLGIFEYFENLNMDFSLLRPEKTNSALDAKTRKQKMVVFAGSHTEETVDEENSKSVELKLFDSGWVLRMERARQETPHWVYWGPVVITVAGALSALAVLIILVDKKEHEKQLYRMMPRRFIRRIHKGSTIIERYKNATICTLDIVSFTTISGSLSASEVMEMLKFLYTIFDRLARKHNVFNVETIGDAYIVIGGGPDQSNPVEGAKRVASFALDVVDQTSKLSKDGCKWKVSVRAGVASGPVIAGVLGTKLVPKLTLFGKTMDLAESLEAASVANQVLCSNATYQLLQESKNESFLCDLRDDGKIIRCHERKIKVTFWIKGVNQVARGRNSESINSPIDLIVEGKGDDKSIHDSDSVESVVTDNSASRSLEKDIDIDLISPDGKYDDTNAKSPTSKDLICEDTKEESHHHIEPLNTRRNSISFSLTKGIPSKAITGSNASNSNLIDNENHQSSSVSNKSFSLFDDDDKTYASIESSAYHDYWSLLSKNHEEWQDNGEDRSKHFSISCIATAVMTTSSMLFQSIKRSAIVSVSDKKIIIISVFLFVVLCSVGVGTVRAFAKNYEENSRKNVVQKALDTDLRLGNELQKKFIPLFALGTLAENLPFFQELPSKMEAIPPYLNKFNNTYRNVTGICDDESKRSVFYDMASSIKQAASLRKILVNLQLAPHGVLCMTYPLNNTEDFDDGRYLDTSGAIGLDLLEDSSRRTLTKKAAKDDRWTIQGPIKLVQRELSVVDQAVIGRYPMNVPYHNVTIDGKSYDLWGFSVALMDWDRLKRQVGLYEFFERNNMEFKMTSTNIIEDKETGQKNYDVKTIAKSLNSHVLDNSNTESVRLESTDNDWVLVVGTESGFQPTWEPLSMVFAAVASFLVSFLIFMVLVASKEHELLLYRMMPKNAIQRLRRGETVVDKYHLSSVFFSHLIGFSTLSGEMKPEEFMTMLNQIYGEFDKLTLKHKVSKIETIGDHYIVTSVGPNGFIDPAEGTARVALFAEEAMEWVKNYRYKNIKIYIRAGIASGPMVSGVIGAAVPKYTIFGDTVNFASRMESTSKSMRIQISEQTYEILQNNNMGYKFHMEERIEQGVRGLMVKGKGLRYTWWLQKSEKERFDSGAVWDTFNSHEFGEKTKGCKSDKDNGEEGQIKQSPIDAKENNV